MIYVLLSALHFSLMAIYFARALVCTKNSLVNGIFSSCFLITLTVFNSIAYSQTEILLISYLICIALLLSLIYIQYQNIQSFIVNEEYLEIVTYIVTFVTIVIFALSVKINA